MNTFSGHELGRVFVDDTEVLHARSSNLDAHILTRGDVCRWSRLRFWSRREPYYYEELLGIVRDSVKTGVGSPINCKEPRRRARLR